MKKLAIVTSTRAEYGLLSPVIKELRKKEDTEFQAELIVTGTHLSEEYGFTIKEIDDRIDWQIPIPVRSDSELNISANQAETLVKFTKLFREEHYDAVLLLGDRYETLAIAIAAGNTRIPIIHLCGGDTTEGAMDEWIRHSLTKMSYLHFVTNEESRRRVIQMGENPDRVFNFGSTSVDNIVRMAVLSKEEVLNELGLGECRYALCTYHPVTMENDAIDSKIEAFLEAIGSFPDIEFIITKSNADQDGARINELLDKADREISNVHVFVSLGTKRYLALMRWAEFVLGNSSSGIIETPVFRVPTVNIGDRQRGRLQTDSIINCGTSAQEIKDAIRHACSPEHKNVCQNIISPYGEGSTAPNIANKVMELLMSGRIDLKKKFYDINI